jgi:hypothetical protein
MTPPERRRAHAAAAGAAFALAFAGVALTALADDPPSESEIHILRGVDLRRAGRNAEALGEFQAGFALSPTPRARAQIALALQAMGNWLSAERGLVEALQQGDDAWIAQYRDVLEGALATVRGHLAWLYVEVDVAEGDLLISGARVRALPLTDPVRVVAGSLDIEVRAPGHAPGRATVDVPPGGAAHARLTLQPFPPEAQSRIQPARPPSPSPPLAAPQTGDRRLAAMIALATAGVLAGAGAAAWVVYDTNASIYNNDAECLSANQTRGQKCGGYADAAKIALGAEIGALAGAAVAAGIGAWLLWRPPAAARPAHADVWCAAGGALRIVCGGTF